MPELPDLLYIRKALASTLVGRRIVRAGVAQPVVVRNLLDGPVTDKVAGRTLTAIRIHGPFLCVLLSGEVELIINLMLAGELEHAPSGSRPRGFLCLALEFDDGSALRLSDRKKMAKVYCTTRGAYAGIPRFADQGIDVLSPEFTAATFAAIAARHRRMQVRALLNDQTVLSAIGNAYADEILFEARIHPKTLVARLDEIALYRLHAAIRSVLEWAALEVEHARAPTRKKVRGHLRVRNRKGEPCPRCGTRIRREGVRGHDVFFCPRCQPPTRIPFIDWRDLG